MRHHDWDQGEHKTLFTVYFASQGDETGRDSVEVLAENLERVDQRSVRADGTLLRFNGDIVEITSVI
ncbi:hypothetical protein [Geomonas limicola]|nr:hypothetical protein [Geomonas limicola]